MCFAKRIIVKHVFEQFKLKVCLFVRIEVYDLCNLRDGDVYFLVLRFILECFSFHSRRSYSNLEKFLDWNPISNFRLFNCLIKSVVHLFWFFFGCVFSSSTVSFSNVDRFRFPRHFLTVFCRIRQPSSKVLWFSAVKGPISPQYKHSNPCKAPLKVSNNNSVTVSEHGHVPVPRKFTWCAVKLHGQVIIAWLRSFRFPALSY